MSKQYKKGFTIIEIIIVVAALGAILAIVLPQFAKIREQQVLKTAVSDATSSLDKARSETLASVNSSSYGVHFQSGSVIIFKGTLFSAGDSNNDTINLTAPANISNVTLGGVSGSSGELYFNRLYGTPSKTGTITISTSSFSKTITISSTGSVSTN